MSRVLDVRKDAKGRWTPIVGVIESKSGKSSTTKDPRRPRLEIDIDDGKEIKESNKGETNVCHAAPMFDAVQQYINPLCHEKKIKSTETEKALLPGRPASCQDKTWKARVREMAAHELIYNVNDYGGTGMIL